MPGRRWPGDIRRDRGPDVRSIAYESHPASFDAIVIGGGPGGAVAALCLARAGHRVVLLEKDRHPRFHIGESILPRAMPLLRELGLIQKLVAVQRVAKSGAEFAFGGDAGSLRFDFADGLAPGETVFNVERAPFDRALLEAARDAGATVHEATAVRSIDRLAEQDVAVTTGDGRRFGGRVLIDASGHGCVVGRHLGTCRAVGEASMRKVAYFQHFEGVERPAGAASGHPCIVMTDEGWFWLIGISPERTSVGFVTRPGLAREAGAAPTAMLEWAIDRCPFVRNRMRSATGAAGNRVLADFSYTCAPFAGPGYFLVGDAGAFLDPIFSTGVTLAMMGGRSAADAADAALRGRSTWRSARRRHTRFVRGSSGIFWRLIRGFYTHGFRELLMNGTGPLGVHRAIISVLAGQVFPRPAWRLRWRLALFHGFVALQKHLPLVRRRAVFRLMDQPGEATRVTAVGGPPATARTGDAIDRSDATALDPRPWQPAASTTSQSKSSSSAASSAGLTATTSPGGP